jgi:hypothetical protein
MFPCFRSSSSLSITSSTSPMTTASQMLQGFLRHEARVHATHHHRHILGAEPIGDLISAVDVARHRGNSRQVRLQIEIDSLDVLVREHHLAVVFQNRGGNGEQPGKGRIQRPIEVNRASCKGISLGINEVDEPRWMSRVRTEPPFRSQPVLQPRRRQKASKTSSKPPHLRRGAEATTPRPQPRDGHSLRLTSFAQSSASPTTLVMAQVFARWGK